MPWVHSIFHSTLQEQEEESMEALLSVDHEPYGYGSSCNEQYIENFPRTHSANPFVTLHFLIKNEIFSACLCQKI